MNKKLNQIDISGWGGYPVKKARVVYPENIDQILIEIQKGDLIARGNGRAYGDSSINEKNTISMKYLNHILSFDDNSGILVVETGILLNDIINTFLPRGWFPYVTPGSKFVTVGGLIAADVHGKNHHKEGSFRNFVEWFEIINSKGEIKKCSKKENSELFEWTIGGMGLTGIIIRAAIKLRPIKTSWIKQKTLVAKDIDQTLKIFENNMNATYSVAWINSTKTKDNIGQSLIMLGEHASIEDLDKKNTQNPLKIRSKKNKDIPFYFPDWFLNKKLIKLFNFIYYFIGKITSKEKLVYWDDYFYPLDTILGWNKIYGQKGFVQYQCVIPLEKSKEGLIELLREIEKSSVSSFLSVLKRFGDQTGNFSFPMKGYTIALDFPINKDTFNLLDKLDEITLKYNGRFYLAKDARMSKKIFRKSDKRIQEYVNFRNKNNFDKSFKSSQSSRLEL
tara:strand:- start:3040 stop:4383 length:1344 start_codon:yes stop_codon:yes gene_type:complete